MPVAQESPNRVTVVDVDIKFGTMVWLMIKSSFAAAIAAFVTSILWAALAVFMVTLVTVGVTAVGVGLAGVGLAVSAPPPMAAPTVP